MQVHLVYQYISMCVLIRHTFYESLIKICVSKHKCRSFLWYFLKHRAMFSACPNKESLNVIIQEFLKHLQIMQLKKIKIKYKENLKFQQLYDLINFISNVGIYWTAYSSGQKWNVGTHFPHHKSQWSNNFYSKSFPLHRHTTSCLGSLNADWGFFGQFVTKTKLWKAMYFFPFHLTYYMGFYADLYHITCIKI